MILIIQREVQLKANAFITNIIGQIKNIDANPFIAISQSRSPPVISDTNIISPPPTNSNATATTGTITIAVNTEFMVTVAPPISRNPNTNKPPTRPYINAFNIDSYMSPSATILEKKRFGFIITSLIDLYHFLIFCMPLLLYFFQISSQSIFPIRKRLKSILYKF